MSAPRTTSDDLSDQICIGLLRPSVYHSQLHLGIIYIKEKQSKFLHFADHLKLLENNYYPDFSTKLYWVKIDVDELDLPSLLTALSLVYPMNSDKLPYATGIPLGHFNVSNGVITLSHGSPGLSCSSFVAFVFEQLGYPLVITSDWPTRFEDYTWLVEFAREAVIRGVPCTHVVAMLSNKDTRRLRPQEVAAAGASPIKPAHHTYCIPLGQLAFEFLVSSA